MDIRVKPEQNGRGAFSTCCVRSDAKAIAALSGGDSGSDVEPLHPEVFTERRRGDQRLGATTVT